MAGLTTHVLDTSIGKPAHNILIELFFVITFTPIIFKIFEPHFNLGLSFLLSSSKFLKVDTPLALAAIKKIIKNSSIASLFKLDGQLIDFRFLGLSTKTSAIASPL